MINFAKTQKVLIVAAHPDDEMLGCGGTIARLRQEGKNIHILLLGEGPAARTSQNAEEARSVARSSAHKAAATLGIDNVCFAALPDNRFDTVALLDIVQIIEKVAAMTRPDVVFTHHAWDMNQDHRITHQAVMTAFRPLPDTPPVTLLGFEVLSSTEYTPAHTVPSFSPNIFINIAQTFGAKQKALEAYASEMRPWPHPRSFEAVAHLAALRGCACGCEAAEAFVLYRNVLT
ncbi:PIG-L family deacetylase [Desulfovibrio sp. 86]|uniref:N-acetylglucosaminyl-phosphatidylinositol de-N-acetylase family protein n=1 Tax=uncultured Desulfovibrio sp. TaxID=167968 RepID=A0A212L7D0_9BACT|nr:PIG-L family deacetylase [Desulfovibrio sp. 86]SCM73484.1 N-acetylglucosaminyl-phosphatidylinositol de-N-acetylase family protein [uncultured Desulfovibrio sp.]VZH34225.1 N-acetylglucosaminyl-phosphatidylinositol de-N-acetylase family protein [Desulfovibrio sp. 86]